MEGQREPRVITLEQMTRERPADHVLVRRYQDRRGTCLLRQHTVYPGIHLLYKAFHRPDTVLRQTAPGREKLVIEHCEQGCVECRDPGHHFYLEGGDAGLRRTGGAVCDIAFSGAHYRGIDLEIDLDPQTEKILGEVGIRLETLLEKFGLTDGGTCVFRRNAALDQVFSLLYSAPEPVKEGYYKVKTLECLLFLQGMEQEEASGQGTEVPAGQLRLAQEVHRYLLAHLSEPLTVEQLARRFNTSATRLKESFRAVYGTSIRAFLMEQRIRSAAVLLRQTDRKVADIAGEVGYANASKFAAVFQRIMGESPAQYRREQQDHPR